MASNESIKIDLNISDNGTGAQVNKTVKEIKLNADAAAKSMAGIGSQRVSAAAPSRAAASAQQASMSTSDRLTYNQARAGIGTGASARDFAKQSQGLDGLVRVYATFAANLFAVTAAFTALKEAANTENMVKGLDALGASSGRSLGTLSKELVSATGGAISLRDAMTSVAQASSAGLSNKQIKELSVVASKASNALGISMTDSISRLSRGIAKIEPELLDELGIFVKVDDATAKYALSVGKTVSSLSDFEKRQAFANAVLEQGRQKFAAIEATANPYDKLLASISNLSTAGLTLVNKVLGPIVSLLSESPVALSAVFLGISTLLLKQAIPALGQWRQELAKTAADSSAKAKKIFDEYQKFSTGKSFDIVGKLDTKAAALVDIAKSSLTESLGQSGKIMKMLGTGAAASEVSTYLEKEIARTSQVLKASKELLKAETDPSAIQALKDKVALEEKRLKNLQANTLLIQKAADFQAKSEKVAKSAEQEKPWYTQEGMRRINAQRAANAAISSEIVSKVASDTQFKGVGQSFSDLSKYIKQGIPAFDEAGNAIAGTEKKLVGLAKTTTLLKGSLVILGSALATAFNAVAPYIGILIAAYSLFDSFASKAAKQQEEFNQKTDETTSAVKTLDNTFDLYIRKTKNGFSLEGISAFTTALGTLSDSLSSQILAFGKYKEAAGAWDTFKDKVLAGFGKGNLDELQKGAVSTVQAVNKALVFSGSAKESRGLIAKVLFGESAKPEDLLKSTDELNKAFDGLTEAQREQKIEKIADAIAKIQKQEEVSTNAVKAFAESLTSIDKIVDQIVQTNAFTDLQGKLGVELVQASQRLSQALIDPLKALESLAAIAKDPKLLSALTDVDTSELTKAVVLQKQLNDAREEYAKAQSNLDKARSGQGPVASRALDLSTIEANVSKGGFEALRELISAPALLGAGVSEYFRVKDEDVAAAKAAIKSTQALFEDLQLKAAEFSKTQVGLVTEIATAGFNKIQAGLKYTKELANINVSRAALGIVSEVPGVSTAKEEYSLRVQELNLQKRLVEASYNSQLAVIKNTQQLEELTAIMQKAEATRMADTAKTDFDKKLAKTLTDVANDRLAVITADKSGKSVDAIRQTQGDTIARSVEARRNEFKIPGLLKEGQLAQIQGEIRIAGLRKEAAIQTDTVNLVKQRNELERKSEQIKQGYLDIAKQINATENISDRESRQLKLNELYRQESLELAEIARQRNLLKIGRGATSVNTKEAIAQLDLRTANVQAERRMKTLGIEIQNIQEDTNAEIAKANKSYEIANERLRQGNSIQEARIANLQEEYGLKQQLGLIDDKSANALKAENELILQKLRYSEQANKLQQDLELKQRALIGARDIKLKADEAAQASADANKGVPVAGALKAQEAAATALGYATTDVTRAQEAISTNETLNQLIIDRINSTKLLNDEIIKQRDHLASIQNITELLADTFGAFGKSVGDVVKATDTLFTNNKKRTEQEKINVDLVKKGLKTQEQADEERAKNSAAEIADQGKIAGAVKGMFKEKTAAYKAFHVIEIGLKLTSLAMEVKTSLAKSAVWLKEVALKGATEAQKTAFESAGFFGRLPMYIAGIYGSTLGQLGPFGPPVAAALVAMLLAMVGGGGGAKMPSGFTAAQQQKVQGTGQAYEGDKIRVREGGVTGDATALADSVTSSMDMLSKEFFGLLGSGSSKIVMALQSIEENTQATAKALLGATVGMFGRDSNFGTMEGSSKSSTLVGMLSGLWGSSSTKILDAGIMIEGTINKLKDGIGKFVQYEKTVTQSSSFFGLVSDTSYKTKTKQLNDRIVESVSNIFDSVGQVLVESGKALEGQSTNVQNVLNTLNITLRTSGKGLSGKEFSEALLAEISVQLNIAAKKAFPYIEQFNKIGEEMFETVARIVKDAEVVNSGLGLIGLTITKFVKTTGNAALDSILAQQDLIKQAGGLDKLASSIEYYFDNFVDASTRFDVKFKQLTKTFKDAGLELPKTKEEYVKLVNTITDTKQLAVLLTSSEAYTDLLDRQSSALNATVSTIEDSISKFKDFITSLKSFRDSLVLSASSTATPLEKYTEAKTQFESTYASALAGDKDAMGKLTNISQTFLDLSKQLYASSDQYTQDFNYILDKVNSAITSAQATVDVEQLKLDYAKSTVDLLSVINENIAKIAGVPAKAGGGYARGLTLVGERGPELVDFNSPGRVYTADQTAGMFKPSFNNQPLQAVVQELQQLRKEVADLRADQQKQTGDIIISNYDANQKAAETVSDTVSSSIENVSWDKRSESVIK